MEQQEKRVDFDLLKIKEQLKQKNIVVSDDSIQIPNVYALKQYHENGKDKLFLKQYYGIFVELNLEEEELNHNNNNPKCSKPNEELPEIFKEHTLEMKQILRTDEYIYKKSTQLLFDIDQWKIYTIQQQDGMHRIFRLFSKLFYIINHLWQNHSQYQINLDLNNFTIDSENKIIIFNQSDVSDKKQNIAEQEENYIYQFGNFMLEILKDINSFIKEQTHQEKIILNSCCEFLQLIFQNKIQNLNQIRINFYEIITKTFFSYIVEEKIYYESYEIYKNQFEIFKNKNKEFTLPKYYKNRNLEFDFKQVKTIEVECQNNITQNINTLKNYLILSSINTRFKRNYLQSIEYLNKAIELDPFDIDILIGFMMILVYKRSQKLYQTIRFSLNCLSDLIEDYWQIYYIMSWLYDRDQLVNLSLEYMTKTYKLNNTDPQILALNATIHLQLKQISICDQLIDQAIAENKNNYPIVYYRKGFILDENKIDGSLEWYKKSLEIDPLYSDNYFEIGVYYQHKQQIKKAIESFDKCIAIDPYDVDACLAQEYNYFILYDQVKQKQYLDKVIEIDPNNYQGYYQLGLLYRDQNDHEESIQMWKKSIQLNPTAKNSYYLASKQLRSTSQIVSSIQYYKKYQQLKNSYDTELFSLSLLYLLNLDFESSELQALEQNIQQKTANYTYRILNSLTNDN